MFGNVKPKNRRVLVSSVFAVAVIAVALISVGRAQGASTVNPLPVTPYSGFSSTLTRSPYVTDLTQTSAYVNWATNSSSPGSLQVSPVGSGGCPASTTTWSTSAGPLPVPTQIPYQASGSTGTTTAWAFSVVNGAGTTIHEYQASVLVKSLLPGHAYCYAVFSTDKAGATDLLPPSTNPSLKPLKVQSFTTLSTPAASSTAPVKFDVIDDTGENYECTTSNSCGSDVPFNPSGTPVNPDEASLYQQIGASGAQFLIDAGDTGYNNGSQTNLGDLEQTGTTTDVSNFFGPSYDPLAGGTPTFSASGDHDQSDTSLKVWPTPTSAANSGGAYAFDSVTNVDGITGSAPADWYAFSTGNVRIYVIDGAWGESASSGKLGTTTGSLCGPAGSAAASGCRPYEADVAEHWQTSSAEYKWLASDLSNPANSGMVKFAVFHFPLRSDSSTEPSDLYAQNSSANPGASTSLEALLSKNGVDVAFNGHAHIYQRTIPSGPGQVINYVTGGGGGVLEPVQGPTTADCENLLATSSTYAIGWSPTNGTGSACGTTNVPTSIAQVYNFLQVSVTGDKVTVSPTNAAGQIFDPQTYTFGTSPPSNDFSIAAGPASATVTAGSVATSTISTALTSGSTQSVALSAAGAPTGAVVSFSPQTLNVGQSSTMTVSTSSSTPTGSFPIKVTGTGSSATHSTTFTLTVTAPPPTTSVLIPANGATLSGTSTVLDASASNATSVEFRIFGGSYGYSGPVIGTATPTQYGWLCSWNTTTVANGSYVLLSEAFNSGGSAFSNKVSITIKN